MKVIEGGKPKRENITEADVEGAAMRAQEFARKAIIRFMQSEAEAHPDGPAAVTWIGMQCGFLLSVIEVGFIATSMLNKADRARTKYDKDYFVGLAGHVFDDVASREDE